MKGVKVLKETETTLILKVDGNKCWATKHEGMTLEDYVNNIRKHRRETDELFKRAKEKYESSAL